MNFDSIYAIVWVIIQKGKRKMIKSERYEIVYNGNVGEFEERILNRSEQEIRTGRAGHWCRVADIYARQLTIISINPYPEEPDELGDHENLPFIKHINKNTEYDNFYRWGIHERRTENHRIIYGIHNFHKVIMLYYFDKQYNGLIKRDDLIPAEINYEHYCGIDPSLY